MAGRPHFPRPRAWAWGAIIALALLGAIGALVWHDGRETARPALWRISQGAHHGWLFGTIHAVPAGARWLSSAIETAAADSDLLVLEAADLAEERSDRGVFEALGRAPDLPPLARRLGREDAARLAALVRASPGALRDLDGYESWAAALLVGAAANGRAGASAQDAGEAVLERLFRGEGRPVLGLESVREQLGLFDALAPADQDALLRQAVRDASGGPETFRALYGLWARGDMDALEQLFRAPLDQHPALREALVERRNALWARRIDKLLRDNGKVVFVAVGAGHLPGDGGLIARLAARGWRLERVQ